MKSNAISSKWSKKKYSYIDVEPVIEFALRSIAEFDLPVDAVVPTSHGSALAVLERDGQLALPIMAYEAQIPDDIYQAYEVISPPYDDVYAPVNLGALTLARQLLWQETRFPDEFRGVS